MGKFKKGDRVRLTRDNMGFGEAGDAGEIVNPDAGCEDALVRFDSKINGDHEWFAPWSSLELVPVAEATGTVKIGDKVVVLDNLTRSGSPIKEYPIGVTLTVDRTCGDGYGNEAYLFNGHHQYLRRDQIEPFTQNTLTIEAGKFYRTRDGRKVGPMRRWSDEAVHRWEADDDDLPYIWADDGTEVDSDINDGADLVAEADEPPAESESTKEILDELEAWIAEQDAIKAAGKGSTAGFTVPVFDDDDFDIFGYRDSDDCIVQLSVGELTAALADSLKVARKVGKTIKRGDMVMLARPALVTGIDRYHASVQTDGGNYSLPLAALTAA